ncbi:MAG: hypothetical protein Q7T11_09160 [Deltaproteobacteria bacterium]|nr:hypothetical protein [Deltaproteobacteria bacterium]
MSLEMESLFSAVDTGEEAAYFNLLQKHFVTLSTDSSTLDLREDEMPLESADGVTERHRRWETITQEFQAMVTVGPNEKNVRGFLGALYAGMPSQMLDVMVAQAGYSEPPPPVDARPDSQRILSGYVFWETTDSREHLFSQVVIRQLENALIGAILSADASCTLSFSVEEYTPRLVPQWTMGDGYFLFGGRNLYIGAGRVELSCQAKKKKIPV